jgi:hypothetical protein
MTARLQLNSTQANRNATSGRASTYIWLVRIAQRRTLARSTPRKASGSAPAPTTHGMQIGSASS